MRNDHSNAFGCGRPISEVSQTQGGKDNVNAVAAALIAHKSCVAVFCRFCKSWRMVAGLSSFSDVLPSSFLQGLVLGTIIGRGLIAHLRGSFADVTATTAKLSVLVEMLPVEWFRAGQC